MQSSQEKVSRPKGIFCSICTTTSENIAAFCLTVFSKICKKSAKNSWNRSFRIKIVIWSWDDEKISKLVDFSHWVNYNFVHSFSILERIVVCVKSIIKGVCFIVVLYNIYLLISLHLTESLTVLIWALKDWLNLKLKTNNFFRREKLNSLTIQWVIKWKNRFSSK